MAGNLNQIADVYGENTVEGIAAVGWKLEASTHISKETIQARNKIFAKLYFQRQVPHPIPKEKRIDKFVFSYCKKKKCPWIGCQLFPVYPARHTPIYSHFDLDAVPRLLSSLLVPEGKIPEVPKIGLNAIKKHFHHNYAFEMNEWVLHLPKSAIIRYFEGYPHKWLFSQPPAQYEQKDELDMPAMELFTQVVEGKEACAKEPPKNIRFKAQKHQLATKYCIRPYSPIRRLIVDHRTGAGKSREMVEILDNFFHFGNRKLVIVPGNAIRQEFYDELLESSKYYRDILLDKHPELKEKSAHIESGKTNAARWGSLFTN